MVNLINYIDSCYYLWLRDLDSDILTKDNKEYIKLYWKINDILACPPNIFDNSESSTIELDNNSILDTEFNIFNDDIKILQDYQLICNLDYSNPNQDQNFILLILF